MPTLTPNGTRARLDWVARRYDRLPVVAYATIVVASHATGDDIDREILFRDGWRARDRLEEFPLTEETVRRLLDMWFERDQWHEVDRILPWCAAQLAKRARDVERTYKDARESRMVPGTPQYRAFLQAFIEWDETFHYLRSSAAAIAMWTARERPDLNRLSLERT